MYGLRRTAAVFDLAAELGFTVLEVTARVEVN